MKQLWVLAGGNGAGKSTFYDLFLKPIGLPFINADLIARELYPNDPEINSYQAARIAESLRRDLIEEGRNFCFETVFSHPSKIDFLAHAKAHRYKIHLVFIHVDSVQLNKARIAQRVEEGGHHVPDEKVETRIPRTLKLVGQAIPLCDDVRLLDNASLERPFEAVMTIKRGKVVFQKEALPEWVTLLDL